MMRLTDKSLGELIVMIFLLAAVLVGTFACSASEKTTGTDGESRFDSGLLGCEIITDKETGVQYLFAHGNREAGLTVLVDENGKPIVDRGAIND